MTDITDIQDILSLNKCAILVIDKQYGYFHPMERKPVEMIKKASKLDNFIESTRDLGALIIWTQMTESLKLSPPNISHKMTIDGYRVEVEPGEKSYDFYGAVRPSKGEKVVEKKFYDAFADPGLGRYLHSIGKTTVILTGGYGSRCVLATAFGANSKGLNVVLASDLVWDPPHFEQELPGAKSIVNGILGYVISSSKLLDLWRNDKL